MEVIEIKGTIVDDDDKWIYDWCGITSVGPKSVRDAIEKADGDDITVQVNSGGGDVFAGNEMYYLLANYRGCVTVDIIGLAASAATIVSCAGARVRATPGAQYMIHNVSTSCDGDYRVMNHTSGVLVNANKSVSNIYRLKTGMQERELLKLMNEETWMDATRAMELGFIDEIIGDNGVLTRPFSIYNSAAQILSEEVKEKIRNSVKKPDGNEYTDVDILREKQKLNLLRMKGEFVR